MSSNFNFMYDNFLISSQQRIYVILERTVEKIECLEFDFIQFKYGYPNDEVAHPLMKYGLGHYGFFEIHNSPWTNELSNTNAGHSKNTERLFSSYKHYILKFKDVTLEILAKEFSYKTFSIDELEQIVKREIELLGDS